MTRIEQAIRQSLGEIIPEELGVDLISAGMVTEIEEQEGRVRLVVHPGYPCASRLPALRRDIEERVTPLLEGRELALDLSVRIKPHRAQHDMPAMMQAANVIAVASGKGGLLDADIFGPSQPIMLGLPKGTRPETRDGNAFVPVMAHGIQTMSMGYLVTEQTPVVWRGPKASGALTQMMQQTLWHDLDYLIVDLPPGTGDIQLTLAQKIPVAGAVVVTTPQDIALLDAVKGVEMFRKVDVGVLGIVENMAVHICSNCGHEEHVFGQGGADRMGRDYDTPVLGSLPLSLRIREQADGGTPTVAADPDSAEARLYLDTARRMAARLSLTREGRRPFPKVVMQH